MKKVLIAVGDRNYTEILCDAFDKHAEQFILSNQEVLHRRYLEEIVDIETPDILIIHDRYLESSFEQQEDRDNELLAYIRQCRIQYDNLMRIVFLCERPTKDPYLSTLVSVGVMDIFNQNTIDLDQFIQQLSEQPKFSQVEKYLSTTIPLFAAKQEEERLELEKQKEKEKKEKPVRPVKVVEKKVVQKVVERKVVQKVVEKKVVQKVVQKNVIKRDYNIHVTNNTEKVIGVPVKRKTVLIGSPTARNGSSFVSHLLARNIAKANISVSYIESPLTRPYTYDRFFGTQYAPDYRGLFQELITVYKVPNQTTDWTKDGVQLICQNPTSDYEAPHDISLETFIKVLYSSDALINIIDIGTSWDKEITKDLMDIADIVLMVVTPDVPLLQQLEENQQLKSFIQTEKLHFIGNRFSEEINNNPLIKDLLAHKLILTLPSFTDSDVFQAQYQGVFLNDQKDYSGKVTNIFSPLMRLLLPKEVLSNKTRGGFLRSIFNKKISIQKSNQEAKHNNEVFK
ncbi:hypothetical protein NDK25_24005 [Niallia taxi]|nr:hypothetical protein [Niallia taxi]MDE5055284.1 hypothetical protein [Niallia taxi]